MNLQTSLLSNHGTHCAHSYVLHQGDQHGSSEKLLYTAKVRTRGGREGGHARSSDGYLDVRISVPGAPNNGTNPEQLLAAGWSA
jgi:organic hydroperoxide reductase OsmC/OhrA